MQSINASSLRNNGLSDSPTAPVSAGFAPSSNADPAGFASLLRQRQAPPPPAMTVPVPVPAPVPSPAPPSPSSESKPAANDADQASTREASDKTEAPQATDAGARARALLKSKARAADGIDDSQSDAPSTADAADAAQAAAGTNAAADKPGGDTAPGNATGTAPIDPNVMQWLAGLQRAAGGSAKGHAADGATGTDGKAATDDPAQAAAGDTRRGAVNLRAADLKAEAELKDKAQQGDARLADAANSGHFAEALAEQRLTEKPLAAPTSAIGGAKDAASVMAGALAPAPHASTDVAAPTPVVVATPVNAPDFAQELGMKLSVLARDGVQQAELHLNPPDMGPVSVQITMDGTQAHVAFGADMAATRHAIEAGLPELASALRDAGFTLAGGGVSQHSSQHPGGRSGGSGSDSNSANDGQRQQRMVSSDAAQRVGTAARRIVSRGGVDLFA